MVYTLYGRKGGSSAISARQPCWIARAVRKGERLGIPAHALLIVIRLAHQVTGDGRVAADQFAGDGLCGTRPDAGKEITDMVLANLQFDLGLLQESFLASAQAPSQEMALSRSSP